jgi:small subunit ribosomal protein S14
LGFRLRNKKPDERRRNLLARKGLLEKQKREPKYKTRSYNRCFRCGRSRSYYRKFGLCRICLRELAHEGKIPGLTKSSW